MARSRIGLATLAAASAIAAAGCSSAGVHPSGLTSPPGTSPTPQSTSGVVQFKTPPAGHGCTGAAAAPGGGATIPVTVSAKQGQVAAMANVCINGKGPFPFLIDTGADGSILTTALAKKVGLSAISQPLEIGGAGCTAVAHISRVSRWNVDGLALSPQTITFLNVPLFGQKGEPDGVIGSDVWSRFGAMKLDFKRGVITVPGHEHAVPARQTIISTPSTVPVPRSLLAGKATVTVPMRVDMEPAFTNLTIRVKLGTNPPAVFTPDTGATQSAVDSGVAARLGLTKLSKKIRQATVCTVATLPQVNSGAWSVAGHALVPQALGTVGLERTTGVAGLLGSDQMSRFGSVIFDYSGGRLLLGAG